MHGRWFLALSVLSIALLMGCGGGGGAKPAVAAGSLAVLPATLNFGKVAVGAHKNQTATLTAGDSSITVRSADWTGEGFSVSGVVFPLTVHAGQSVHLKVTFAPLRAGSSEGKISFESDADNVPEAGFRGKGTQSGGHSVTLAWQPIGSVVGYQVYRGMASQGPYTRITSAPQAKPSFTDASVVGGKTYFYMTTAVSKNGKESKFSNQARVTIPVS